MKRLGVIALAFVLGWLAAMLTAGTPYAGDIKRVIGPGTLVQLQTPWGMRTAFAPFWESWQLVDAIFFDRDRIDHGKMIQGAIDGMLATLDDKYTFYQEPDKAAQTTDDMAGKTAGIGIFLRFTDGRAYVWKLIPDAPASKSGVRQNDEILQVDDQLVATLIADKSVDEAATALSARIRGKKGTAVTLVVQTNGDTARTLTIMRDDIILPSVEWQRLEGNVAYINITEFKRNTPDVLADGMRAFAETPVTAMILDLRRTPGGLLDSAQRVLGFFYDGTALWEERQAGALIELTTTPPESDFSRVTVPLFILVDERSASASEVVAGALRDRYPNTLLIGTQTFGKGIVQNIYPLSNGGTVRLTMSQWLTPNKLRIHGLGLTPDIVVNDDPAARADAPCVADRMPKAGDTLCRDPQLTTVLGLISALR
jgi:carboxyl-terminal processing protease